jgi:hypothetical protein
MMTDYEVGYRIPPKRTQFKKGQSGNPRGRPKRPEHAIPEMHKEPLKALILMEAYRLVDIIEGGKKIRVPLIQAIIRRQAVLAAQGRSRAARDFMEGLRSIEEGRASTYFEYAKALMNYKEEAGRDFERRKELNPSEPEPIPHPDDIIEDPNTGRGQRMDQKRDCRRKPHTNAVCAQGSPLQAAAVAAGRAARKKDASLRQLSRTSLFKVQA